MARALFKNVWGPRGVLVVVWLLVTLANIAKPFHMDDTAGLLIADAILRAPLHPMGELLNWLDTAEPVFITNQPHLFFYATAAMSKLFVNSELAMHLLLSLFSLLAIFCIHALLRRTVPQHALWATCASALGPGFLINQNAMTDMPLLALMTLAILLATRSGSKSVALGFAAFSAALLVKYSALFLFPSMVWATFLNQRNRLWIALPILTLVGWSLFNYFDYGAIHILNRPANSGGVIPSPKLTFALVCNLGLFAVPVAVMMVFQRPAWLAGWLLGAAVFFAAQLIGLGHSFQMMMLPNSALFAGAFVVLLAAALRAVSLLRLWGSKGFDPQDTMKMSEMSLVIWLIGGFGFLVTFPPFMASRHALLLLPPLLVLALGHSPRDMRVSAQFAVVGIWALVGAFVMGNDISFAGFYRDQAPIAALRAQDLAGPGAAVFSRGHWGWQWYAAKAGLAEFDTLHSNLQVGDILVDPVGISAQFVENIEDFEVLERFIQPNSLMTLLDTHRFYASGALALPIFATGPAREIRILRKSR